MATEPNEKQSPLTMKGDVRVPEQLWLGLEEAMAKSLKDWLSPKAFRAVDIYSILYANHPDTCAQGMADFVYYIEVYNKFLDEIYAVKPAEAEAPTQNAEGAWLKELMSIFDTLSEDGRLKLLAEAIRLLQEHRASGLLQS